MEEKIKAFFENFIQNCENSERLDSVQTSYFCNWAKILTGKDITKLPADNNIQGILEESNKFRYKGYFCNEAKEFFGDKIIEEERDGCGVVGFFFKLSDTKTHLLSKGDEFIKDENGEIILI